MSDNEELYIAIIPPDDADDMLIKNIAGIIGKPLYDTRLSIAGGLPRIIARFDDIQSTETANKRLRDLGLETMVLREPELKQSESFFPVYTIQFTDEGIIFLNNEGNEKKIKTDDVFLIIKGRRANSYGIGNHTIQEKNKYSRDSAHRGYSDME